MAGLGHEGQILPPRLNGRCRTTKFDHQEQFEATRGAVMWTGERTFALAPKGDGGSCQLAQQRLGLF